MTLPRTTEGRLSTLEANQKNMCEDIHELSGEMKSLNVTVLKIAESLRIFKWVFGMAVAAGPGLGILLFKILETA